MQSSQGNLLYVVVILNVHLLLVRRVVLLLSTSVKKLWPKLPDRSAVLPVWHQYVMWLKCTHKKCCPVLFLIWLVVWEETGRVHEEVLQDYGLLKS
jgi:hypothetical protein